MMMIAIVAISIWANAQKNRITKDDIKLKKRVVT